MKKNYLLRTILVLSLFILFALAGCRDNSIETCPNEQLLFLEYEMISGGEYSSTNPLRMGVHMTGVICEYDESTNSFRYGFYDKPEITPYHKLLFCQRYSLVDQLGSGRVSGLYSQKSLKLIDTLRCPPFPVKDYELRLIDCNSKGEVRILLNNEEITLKPKEVYNNTFIYSDVSTEVRGGTYHFDTRTDNIIIKNHGYIEVPTFETPPFN